MVYQSWHGWMTRWFSSSRTGAWPWCGERPGCARRWWRSCLRRAQSCLYRLASPRPGRWRYPRAFDRPAGCYRQRFELFLRKKTSISYTDIRNLNRISQFNQVRCSGNSKKGWIMAYFISTWRIINHHGNLSGLFSSWSTFFFVVKFFFMLSGIWILLNQGLFHFNVKKKWSSQHFEKKNKKNDRKKKYIFSV